MTFKNAGLMQIISSFILFFVIQPIKKGKTMPVKLRFYKKEKLEPLAPLFDLNDTEKKYSLNGSMVSGKEFNDYLNDYIRKLKPINK